MKNFIIHVGVVCVCVHCQKKKKHRTSNLLVEMNEEEEEKGLDPTVQIIHSQW